MANDMPSFDELMSNECFGELMPMAKSDISLIALVRLERASKLCERRRTHNKPRDMRPIEMRRHINVSPLEPTDDELAEIDALGIEYVDVETLSTEALAVSYLIAHKHLIYWWSFSTNAYAIDYLLSNLIYVDAETFSLNPNAVPFLLANPVWINWQYLSANMNAIDIIMANMDKIDNEFIKINPKYTEILCRKLISDTQQFLAGCIGYTADNSDTDETDTDMHIISDFKYD